MATAADPRILIAGAGPIGLTAALELCRRGIPLRIVDALTDPQRYAKAVGVQPRTLEVFEGIGVLPRILDAAVELAGQIIYVNGEQVGRIELRLPSDVPFGFIAIPQYAVEHILADELARCGVTVERGLAVTSLTQNPAGVTATLSDGETVRTDYLIGADGAHSTVRKALDLTFEGAAFEEQYMLGDVEVDWSLPPGYVIRSMRQIDGVTEDLLVCVPLPGRNRYRMSMLAPADLASTPPSTVLSRGVEHGFEGPRKPELHHIQAVLDRLAPEKGTAHNLRWSSVFRISHRIVDSYGRGRVFVAGDAAHIHPPTGAQGMNTGIQDAHNLAWKLALAVTGRAAPGLLDSYDAERRPVGEEVVGRTVRSARQGIGADSTDAAYVLKREAQLLVDYADSPIVTDSGAVEPCAGQRAPDVTGLTRAAVSGRLRLFDLLGRREHALLCYAGAEAGDAVVSQFEQLVDAARDAARGPMEAYLIAAPAANVDNTVLPLIRDADGHFAQQYAPAGTSVFVVRPDGYLGYRGAIRSARGGDVDALLSHLGLTFG